jgi:hypothetical protein
MYYVIVVITMKPSNVTYLGTLPGTYRDNVTYLITHSSYRFSIAPIYYYPRCLIHNPHPSIIIPSQNLIDPSCCQRLSL